MLYIKDVSCDIQPRVRKRAGINEYSTPFHTILCRVVYDLIGGSSSSCYSWHVMANECEECLLGSDILLEADDES